MAESSSESLFGGGVRRLWLVVVVGVVVVGVVVGLVLRGGGDGGVLLLVRSGDLYVVGAGSDVGRDDRVVEDLVGVRSLLTSDGGRGVRAGSVAVDGGVLVAAESVDGFGVWVVSDGEVGEVLVAEGEVGGVVVGDRVFLREVREGSERCYRGVVGDLERVFRGDVCWFVVSGHLLGADWSDDVVGVRVESPEGEELLRGRFGAVPVLSDDGGYLVVEDEKSVSVVSVESGEVVWESVGAVGVESVSGVGGGLLVGAQTADGHLVVAVVDGGGVRELFETESDAVFGELGPSGGLFLVETTGVGGSVLWGWDGTSDEVEELASHDGALSLVGVADGSGVVVNRDDFGVRVRRFFPDGRQEDLYDFDDDSGLSFAEVRDGVLYLVGAELAAVLPLNGGEGVESERWDRVTSRGIHDGLLVAAGLDGATEILFSLSSEGYVVEYGEYDQIWNVSVHDQILYATVGNGEDVDTYAFDTQTGDPLDDPEYRDAYLVANQQPPQRASIHLTRNPALIKATPTTQPATPAPTAATTTTLLPPTPSTTAAPATTATAAATTAAASGRIAYESDRDLYVYDLGTGREEQITDNASLFDRVWSPDGGRIAYISGVNTRVDVSSTNAHVDVVSTNIHVYDLSTGHVEQITDNASTHGLPDWSPDGGSRIAYGSVTGDGSEIYVYDLSTGRVEEITDDANHAARPVWSPDGGRIAYQSDRDGDYEIYVQDLSTGHVEQITDNTSNDRSPVWSPDGGRIAYQSDRGGDDEIYIHDLDTGRGEQITDNISGNRSPVWSPDGGRIAYRSDRDRGIYIHEVDTGRVEQITDNAWSPVWSPDGGRIAYVSGREIYIHDVETGRVEQITDNTSNDRSPVWSPDGGRIAYVSDLDGDDEIYVYDLGTRRVEQITDNTSDDRWPVWSP